MLFTTSILWNALSPTMATSAAIHSSFSPFCWNPRPHHVTCYSSKRSSIICSLSQADPQISNDEASADIGGRISLACPVCFHKLTLISNGVTFANNAFQQMQFPNRIEMHRLQKKLHRKGIAYGARDSLRRLLPTGHGDIQVRPQSPFALKASQFLVPQDSPSCRSRTREGGGKASPRGDSLARRRSSCSSQFEMMKKYLDSVSKGSIVDASCGSGLFARIFSKSGMFSFVVALDFSENMLQQCRDFIRQDDGISKDNIMLVRSDIARLPFVSGSVDAVHAGAAMHCWPSPVLAVAEICRVLKPGGVFVGSTFVLDGILRGLPLLEPITKGYTRVSGQQLFLDEREIEDICSSCGLVDYRFERSEQFIMFCAKKRS